MVIRRTRLGQIRRRHIHRDAPHRKLAARIAYRGAHPFTRFLHRRIRQPHYAKARQSRRYVNLDLNDIPVQPHNRAGNRFGKHSRKLPLKMCVYTTHAALYRQTPTPYGRIQRYRRRIPRRPAACIPYADQTPSDPSPISATSPSPSTSTAYTLDTPLSGRSARVSSHPSAPANSSRRPSGDQSECD